VNEGANGGWKKTLGENTERIAMVMVRHDDYEW
jgi:hypothetical protein